MPCENTNAIHIFNAGHHLAEFFTTRFLCAFRLLKFLKNFKIFFTRELAKLKELSFNTHNLLIIVLRGLSRVEKIFWFAHISFWIMKKEESVVVSFLAFLPAHRIRICLQDRFGFRPPPSHYRAQARGGIFRPSYELCCITLLCANLFRTANGLIARLVRSLRSREQKPKMFLTFLLFLGGGCGGSRQKMERKFLVFASPFQSPKRALLFFNTFNCSFLRPHGETRRFLSALSGNLKLCDFVHCSW